MPATTDPRVRWNVAVPLPTDDELPARLTDILAANPPLNISRMMAGSLDMFEGVSGLVQAVFTAADVDVKLRQIIILRAAQLTECTYEWQANVIMSRNVGLTEQEIDTIGTDGPVTALDPVSNLICRMTDEITRDVAVSDEALQALLDHFGATVTNKLILIASWFNLLSRYLLSTRVPLETSNKLEGRTSPVAQ